MGPHRRHRKASGPLELQLQAPDMGAGNRTQVFVVKQQQVFLNNDLVLLPTKNSFCTLHLNEESKLRDEESKLSSDSGSCRSIIVFLKLSEQ